jgi:hypothetical protein
MQAEIVDRIIITIESSVARGEGLNNEQAAIAARLLRELYQELLDIQFN